MKKVIFEVRSYLFSYSVITMCVAFVAALTSCSYFEVRELQELRAEYQEYREVSAAYIELLETDLGDEFIDDVESETDEYMNYYVYFPMAWNNR